MARFASGAGAPSLMSVDLVILNMDREPQEILDERPTMDDRTTKIRNLNDLARTTFHGCRLMITSGIQQLSADDVADILNKVNNFDDFSEDNDPHAEHDFGSFQHRGETIFWKIDYYDRTLKAGSEDPANPEATIRVLTVMLASEY